MRISRFFYMGVVANRLLWNTPKEEATAALAAKKVEWDERGDAGKGKKKPMVAATRKKSPPHGFVSMTKAVKFHRSITKEPR